LIHHFFIKILLENSEGKNAETEVFKVLHIKIFKHSIQKHPMDSELNNLSHIEKEIPGGGKIIVLDTGAVITSESEAMLQALHSRSIGGLRSHLKVLSEKGSENFMGRFYVGYGHKSIGDCGTTTLFIEGVSMLVAKAIQDNKLYNGQEASTRYIDFSTQPFVDPLRTEESKEVLEDQRRFYLHVLEKTKEFLRGKYSKPAEEKQSVYDKAIDARAFDIARGFLPAGATTNLAWHSNLRQVADNLLFLRNHPLAEVRDTALAIENAVIEAHPNSFSEKRYPNTETYQKAIAANYFYHDPETPNIEISYSIDKEALEASRYLFQQRPPKAELPKFLSQLGTVSARFKLDFGSFRDLQRHRAISQRMPLLTTDIGFNEWYLSNLPPEIREEAESHLKALEDRINALPITSEVRQYYTSMGYNTSNLISGDLPAMIYMIELRSTRFVHPTLRAKAKAIGDYIQKELNIPVHFDKEPDRFDTKRGEHDITIKSQSP
jgi:thymidylate synthase ThyX